MDYMKAFLHVLILAFATFSALGQQVLIEPPIRFLALGDSYTIGSSVSESERWPNQLVDTLQELGYLTTELNNIAVRGWTTGNLISSLEAEKPEENYNLVSLLIGVNNQFQGRSEVEYQSEFDFLLNEAIRYAQGKTENVVVLSIPDYQYTPFGQNFVAVSFEINQFNAINEAVTGRYGVTYVNITDISRRGLDEPDLVASDGLHPSGKMYKEWVVRLLESIELGNKEIPLQTVETRPPNVFPNPARSELTVNFQYGNDGTIEIYDLHGVRKDVKVVSDKIDISNLEKGVYLIKFRNADNTINLKFIKED